VATDAAAGAVIGRETETQRLLRFVDVLRTRPGAMVITGEPGIGKTTLWDRGTEAALSTGVHVVRTRCVEAEMPLALCALGDLFGDALEDVGERLPAPQRQVLVEALGLEPSRRSLPDNIVLPRAAFTTLGLLSETAPVLIAIDDAQWLDPSSQRILAFALRRVGRRPIAVLATARGRLAQTDPLGLVDAYGECVEELWLGPLASVALREIVRAQATVHVSRLMLKRIHAASGGNPMYALEFARSVGDPSTVGAGAALTLPSSLQELVRTRVRRLPEEVLPLVEIAAALDHPTPALVAEAYGDEQQAAELLDAAVSEGAIDVGVDGLVRFTHPLLASAVYEGMPPARRQRLHGRLVAVARDVEEQARHLALAHDEPAAEVAVVLDEAAEHAAARGAPDAATTLVDYALRLTPPAAEANRAARTLAKAQYLVEACEHSRARAVLDDLLRTDVEGPSRAHALKLRYVVSPPPNIEPATGLLEEALEHSAGDEPLRVRLLVWLAAAIGYQGDYAAAERSANEALALSELLDDVVLLSLAASCAFAMSRLHGGPSPPAFERVLALHQTRQLPGEPSPDVILARERSAAGELETARALLEREVSCSTAGGAEFARAVVLLDLADVELRAGNWSSASGYVDEALEVFVDGENVFGAAQARSARALLAALLGHVDEARALAVNAIAFGEDVGWHEYVARNRWIAGFLELSLGEPHRAWAFLEGLPETFERMELREPGHCPMLPDVAETLVVLGRLDEADVVVARLEASAQALNHRWAIPAAHRARAVLQLARREADDAHTLAEQAAVEFEAAGFVFDGGRAALVAGDALRRLGRRRRAADSLEVAVDIFTRLGAQLWQRRAEQELRRAAPRPRRRHELTEAENRVAALVSSGRTNREVAAELFTTVSTVEAHLTRIYRKLDVRSRTEMAKRMSQAERE
jgi:DNA-binding NarL/FixJ family response regulator